MDPRPPVRCLVAWWPCKKGTPVLRPKGLDVWADGKRTVTCASLTLEDAATFAELGFEVIAGPVRPGGTDQMGAVGAIPAMTPRLCRLCHERPVPASRLRWCDYRCDPCRRGTPAHRRGSVAYEASPERRAQQRIRGARRAMKRIYVGGRYHSMAKTADEASRINRHIKERLRESFA